MHKFPEMTESPSESSDSVLEKSIKNSDFTDFEDHKNHDLSLISVFFHFLKDETLILPRVSRRVLRSGRQNSDFQ